MIPVGSVHVNPFADASSSTSYFLRIMQTPLTSESPAVHSPPAPYFQLTSLPTAAETASTIDTMGEMPLLGWGLAITNDNWLCQC
jgi:hypothetical protein